MNLKVYIYTFCQRWYHATYKTKRRETCHLTSINLQASPNALTETNVEETIFPRREYIPGYLQQTSNMYIQHRMSISCFVLRYYFGDSTDLDLTKCFLSFMDFSP